MLFHAHSGLRYFVLLAAVVALVVLVHGRLTARAYTGPARIVGAVFTGLLDLQVVLGLALLVVWPFYPALTGHIVLMILAAVTAHGLRVAARKATTDAVRYTRALLAVAVPLVLVVAGILAIGRRVL
jgi:hypothetical protein